MLTFCVIFATLVLQGLTLTPLVRWLKIVDDRVTEKEERLARLKANEAALARLEAIASSNRARPKTIERLRSEYEDRIRQLRSEAPDEESVSRLFSEDFEELAREVLQTERDTVIQLRNEKAINDQALRRIQRDIDLAEARLQRPARKSRRRSEIKLESPASQPKSTDVTSDETEAGVCVRLRRTAFDAISAPAHPELS